MVTNNLTSFLYYRHKGSSTLDVVMHGGSNGINSQLITKVFEKCRKLNHSTIAFNFQYLESGLENSSGPELKEELETLQQFLDFCDYQKYKNVRLIAKSLGGIVASHYLNKLSNDEASNFSIIVLGFVTGDVTLKNFNGSITVIQGEHDKFGGINVVKDNLKDAKSQNIKFIEIPKADHSYRNPETKEPLYEDLAIEKIN